MTIGTARFQKKVGEHETDEHKKKRKVKTAMRRCKRVEESHPRLIHVVVLLVRTRVRQQTIPFASFVSSLLLFLNDASLVN